MKKIILFLPILLILLTACPKKDDVIDNRNGNRKIGYLFYTEFIDEFNSSLYHAFSRFKAAGVTDLIVDLRYNHGGSLSAASYLASLIAPRSVVQSKSVFTQLDFNRFINNEYDRNGWSRKSSLGAGQLNPLDANLDLKTVYIIATDDSYSAAELLTFCLRPYMKVVHVGSETGGKFTASMTVTAYDSYGNKANTIYDPDELTAGAKDSLKGWGMQPIVAIYKDSKGNDFSADGTLKPDITVKSHENDLSAYKPIGDQTDYLLATAIAKITGSAVSASQNNYTLPRSVRGLQSAKLFAGTDGILKESVLWTPVNAASQATTGGAINTVSQFVYDGLSVFYKWSDYMSAKVPTAADADPGSYFTSLLYPLDTEHGWSWITDDVSALLADFSGQPVGFGWGLNFFWTDASRTTLVAVVKYVYPNTPVSNAGVVRGDIISKINGYDITANTGDNGDYRKLLGGNMINITIENAGGGRNVGVTPITISTDPVFKDTVYTISK